MIAGEVWGRGTVDMLNITATKAVAFKHLVQSGFQPRGSLVYFAVADEGRASWATTLEAQEVMSRCECAACPM